MTSPRYLIQIYRPGHTRSWGYIVLRTTPKGARRVASANAHNRYSAWIKAWLCVALLRYHERHTDAVAVRRHHQ